MGSFTSWPSTVTVLGVIGGVRASAILALSALSWFLTPASRARVLFRSHPRLTPWATLYRALRALKVASLQSSGRRARLSGRDPLAVHRGITEADGAAGLLFVRVNVAAIEGARIDVQADGALAKFARVVDLVHRLQRVDGTGMLAVHLHRVGLFQAAGTLLQVLFEHAIVLHHEPPNRSRHPAILLAMIVDGANLPNVPADGDQLVEARLVDEVARVVLRVPEEIAVERGGIDGMLLEKPQDLPGAVVDRRLGKLAQAGHETVRRDQRGHAHASPPRTDSLRNLQRMQIELGVSFEQSRGAKIADPNEGSDRGGT